MRRRGFIAALSGAAAWPVVARGQVSPKRPLVGYLTGAAQPPNQYSDIFVQGMRALGYIEGRSFDITYRGSDGYQDRLPALAKELVQLKPDVILANAVDSVVALRNETRTIPIVSPALADAVHLGLTRRPCLRSHALPFFGTRIMPTRNLGRRSV
jgi:putative tryptophan/tyrosine transport system substrate-binding protein